MKLIVVLFLMALLLPFGQTYAETFTGKLVRVLDGDTVEVIHNGKAERVRLAQIDCPEKNQPFGQSAKRFVLEIAAQRIVAVEVETIDRYDRIVGEVFLPDGSNLNKQIVSAGFAWQYKIYSKDTEYFDLEKSARDARRGLWQEEAPVAPWEWRKVQRQASISQPTGEDFTCGSKRYCKEMKSCAEAKYFLKECGLSRLDGNNDGVPCEALCR